MAFLAAVLGTDQSVRRTYLRESATPDYSQSISSNRRNQQHRHWRRRRDGELQDPTCNRARCGRRRRSSTRDKETSSQHTARQESETHVAALTGLTSVVAARIVASDAETAPVGVLGAITGLAIGVSAMMGGHPISTHHVPGFATPVAFAQSEGTPAPAGREFAA